MIQAVSELDQEKSLVQEENHLEYLIWENRLTYLKSLGQVVIAQAKTTERSHICVSQKYYFYYD